MVCIALTPINRLTYTFQVLQQDFVMTGGFPSLLEMGDLTMPFETAFELFPSNASQPEFTGFWSDT